ncbi:MAG TPA: maltose alpha-D-glucosyltransferase [Rhodopila sp.]|uniref:maltose alpha-D-glucosyltransferase n=1 Tax=Rhodopila sp. TaxID=2480087 RepID=UPI002BA4769F|nr:maltose alpha-D-glucosyltransferase [Rhodopila sp.]HVY18218.1 maltose alpha-D-glucosyltransferase [Rhodopila sp.]
MKILSHPRGQVTPNAEILTSDDGRWYQDAVIYQVHVKSYFDSNNDGIGDFPGLTSKLDYIADLGASAIWLLPFYPSPRLDDGYDIADYRGVHPDYGTLADVKQFIAAAHKRGIRVITELVLNHTSDQHPWFQRAREARPGSLYRDFYVWSDTDTKYANTRIIFVDSEKSNWTWDDTAKAFYWHRFYRHQPDLNFDNPRVVKEMTSVLRYWLELGIDGLRLDAVPYLAERDGTNNENLPETHSILRRIRRELDQHYPGRMLLAEANQWPEDTKEYFGEGDECHMAFHFPLMPRMYMAIAQEDRFPITDILRQTPDIPENCQWATFLRNHDELTLEMVTESERDFLWETYAADKRARINLGIRRRLTPLMERDRRRIELMNYLLLSVIGTPVIYYGDEIGMGDYIHLGDRNGVRTPMQWSPDRNGGFSRVPDPSQLVLPLVVDPLYAYHSVNVESQAADQYSVLMWMRQVIAIRKRYPVFGRGRLRLLYPENRKVLTYLREDDETAILCIANLSRTPQAVELDLSEFAGAVPVELHGATRFPAITRFPYALSLPGRGFYWFNLARGEETAAPAAPVLPEMLTLVMKRSLVEAIQSEQRNFEKAVLHGWLNGRRWFGMKGARLSGVRITAMDIAGSGDFVLTEIETVAESNGESASWQVPLGVVWDTGDATALQLDSAIARVRRGAKVGLLTDAFLIPEFIQWLLECTVARRVVDGQSGTLHFDPTPALDTVQVGAPPAVRWPSLEQSNSTAIVDDQIVLKLLRRVATGINPEVEMGRYLSDHGFVGTPKLYGEAYRTRPDRQHQTFAIAQEFVRNQGDAWTWTLEFLDRRLSSLATDTTERRGNEQDFEEYEAFAQLLGRRVAEMHLALADATDQPAFAPELTSDAQAEAVAERVIGRYDAMIAALAGMPHQSFQNALDHLTAAREAFASRVWTIAGELKGAIMTRIHGDLHLGQVLVANGELSILDFEGEPAAPLAQRRAKSHPARDVAGVLRSFDYAGAVATQRSQAGAVITEADVAKLGTSFRADASGSFLMGYRQAYRDADRVASVEAVPNTVDLFVVDKAAYEVMYEIANRPDWVSVPLAAVVGIVDLMLGLDGGA